MKTLALCVIVTGLIVARADAQYYLAASNVWVTAQERARVEYRANNFTFDSGSTVDDDSFLLNRARLGIGAKPCDWFAAYAEAQDAREEFSQLNPPGRVHDEDYLDFHQGWIEVANYKEFPLGLKVGRQELSYGDQRLIGLSDWSNTGRVFDAVKLRWQSGQYWLDFFRANVVVVDDHALDKADWADDFYGLYGHCAALENCAVDAYVLFRDKSNAINAGAARQLYTFGTRITSTENVAPWDYNIELIGQLGHVATPGKQFGETSAAWATQEAFAVIANAGYTFAHDWKPRVGVGFDYASGDSNPTDGKDETFDPLFTTAHHILGFLDVVGMKNIQNPHASFSFSPVKPLKLQIDGHLFWLAESKDAWYRAGNSLVRRDATGNSGNFVGSEIDLTATYTFNKHVKCQAGYSHFFTGDFVAATGPHSDADFAYTQVTLSL